jgi:hypothetical protein
VRRNRTAKQLGTRHDLNYFKAWTKLRRWRVILALAVPVLCLAWLGVAGVRGDSAPYSSGKMSQAHAVLGAKCSTCHATFVGNVRVGGFRQHAEDKACLTCHEAPAHHSNQLFTPTCASCHTEHVGSVQLARTVDASCTQCHQNLRTTTGQARFETAILRFGSKHPEFTPLKTRDPGTVAFNHAIHMRANLPEPIAGRQTPVQLECADCHRTIAESAGNWRFGSPKWQGEPSPLLETAETSKTRDRRYMEPVKYDKNCAACHTLPFDRRSAESVPHEQPEAVHSFVLERLKSYLEQHPAAWRDPEAGRRIPGAEPVTRARNADEWLQAQISEDESLLWRKTCKQCHTLDSGPSAAGTQPALPRVQPAAFTSRWFKHAIFDHSAHAAATCESCHSASLSSKETSDVLIPGIKTCQSCHNGSKAESAESGCFLCHQYHDWKQRKTFKPMYTIPQITGKAE